MRPGGEFSPSVQQMISAIDPWKKDENPIEEFQFKQLDLLPLTVKVPEDTDVLWGIHKEHTIKNPSLSPFVDCEPASDDIGWITIELAGTPMFPLLVRAYSGRYTPSIPWLCKPSQVMESCRYWKTHAYLGTHFIKNGEVYQNPPRWYTAR
jgi:hypothetical protein